MSYGKRAIIAWVLLSGQGETSAKELDVALLRGWACELNDWFDRKSEELFLAMRLIYLLYK